jgi:Tfp pilus assembly PilM family ATPase
MKIKKLSSLVSIAFTGTRLHAAQLRRSGNRVQVVRSMQAALALDPLNNDPQLVGRELRRHLTEAGITERRCVISLPLRWAFVLPVDLPELPEADRASFLALQAERSFPFAPEELSQATNWLAPRRATIIAMPLGYLSKLQSALTAAGLKVVSITLGITSLVDMDSADERRDGIDLLVGDEGLEMAVRAGSGYAALRPLDDAMEIGRAHV